MNPSLSRRRGHSRVMTAAEALLWSHLRDQRLEGWRFRRRLADTGAFAFECPDAAVTVQLQAQADPDPGPLRFTSTEVMANVEYVLQAILLALRTALLTGKAS